MKNRLRTFLILIMANVLIIGTMPISAAVAAEDVHQHNGNTYTEWTSTTSLPTEQGDYYLASDVTLTETWDAAPWVHLCLNGHTIKYSGSADAPVIRVGKDIFFTLYDCQGGSGSITGGTASGVVVDGGLFTLYGGSVQGNKNSGNGGGVVVNSGGFFMYGGAVKGNEAQSGGGVYSAGNVSLSGGEVKQNTASAYGGGVYFEKGESIITDTTITGNTASTGGGIYMGSGVLMAARKPVVKSNTAGGSTSNLYLSKGNVIEVGDTFDDGASIGISMETAGTFTTGYTKEGNTKDPGEFFSSDNTRYDISINEEEAVLFADGMYSVRIDDSIKHGAVKADAARAAFDTKITLTVTPAENYKLDYLKVTDDTGKAVTLYENTFYMPNKDVTVTASFVPESSFVYPTDISLDKTDISVMEGKSASIAATVLPDNASNKDVTWESSNEKVATVDENGKVSAVSVGEATITAKTAYGEKTATCKVTVTEKKYTVTFRDGYTSGAEGIIKTEEVIPGGNATAPADPVRDGYEFDGWDKDFTNIKRDITVSAEWKKTDVIKYIDAQENEKICENYEPVVSGTTELNSQVSSWYAVKENLTINKLTVNGDVNLILCDGVTLTVSQGVTLNKDNKLTIWCQSGKTGTLNATGAYCNPGIGGSATSLTDGKLGGTLTVNGGIINAQGGKNAAGIGCGCRNDYFESHPCTITYIQNGGTVTATGSDQFDHGCGAAGIGGSYNSGGAKVTVNGGSLKATGGGRGAGIGTSQYGSNQQITITGGRVEAIGGKGEPNDLASGGGAGIGSALTIVNISGGEVIAIGNGGGAGIGGHGKYAGDAGAGGELNISGEDTVVTAISNGGGAAIGAGGGKEGRSHGRLNIMGELQLKAGSDEAGAVRKTTAERVNAANTSAYAQISACEHGENTYDITITHHTYTCKYCSKHEAAELHKFNAESICDVCGAHVCTVTLDPNYESGVDKKEHTQLLSGTEYTVPDCVFTAPDGKVFTHWFDGGKKYDSGDKITVEKDITLKANWDGFTWKTLQAAVNNAANGTVITLPEEAQTLTPAADDTVITIPAGKEITIDLNGWTLDRALYTGASSPVGTEEENGNVITVEGNAKLTLKNGRVTGGSNKGNGGGIEVKRNGRLVLTDVDVVHNYGTNGGGIHSDGTVTMTRGIVSANIANYGGGIYAGTRTLGRVSLTGTDIKGNIANKVGGGIYSQTYVFLTDVTVNQNSCGGEEESYYIPSDGNGTGVNRDVVLEGGGVFVEDDDYCLKVKGTVNITGNMSSYGNSHESNVYLKDRGYERWENKSEKNAMIGINGQLSEGSKIGVTYEIDQATTDKYTVFPVTITKDLGGTLATASNFVSDRDNVTIAMSTQGDMILDMPHNIIIHKPGEAESVADGFTEDVILNSVYTMPAPRSIFIPPEGKEFIGWKQEGVESDYLYLDGEKIIVKGNMTFVAQWGSLWQALQNRINAAKDGDTITLDRDYTAMAGDSDLLIPEGKKITIDLNGHKLDRNSDASGSAVFSVGGADYAKSELVIRDSSSSGSGTMTGAGIGIIVSPNSKFTMESGKISEMGMFGVSVQNGSEFTMTGGSITGSADAGVYMASGSVFKAAGSPNITGNTINVSLPEDGVINVTGKLNSDAKIGVTLSSVPTKDKPVVTITSGLTGYADGMFTDDSGKYIVTKSDSGEAVITMEKSTAKVTAKEGLVSTGEPQELVTAEVTGGTIQYALSKSGPFADGPITGTDAGTYQVFYKVVGDATHLDTAVQGPVEVTIAKAPVPVTGVVVSNTALTLKTGTTGKLTATVQPIDADNTNVRWSSSDDNIATVDENGLVTANAAGEATITVTTEDGEKTATCLLTVKDDSPVIYTVAVTDDGNGTASASPASGAAGTAVTLTATPKEGFKFKEWQVISGGVTVSDSQFSIGESNVEIKAIFEPETISVTGVTVSPETLELKEGETGAVTAAVKPDNATDKTFKWTSSDESVATVDESGNVTAIGAGEATIKATSNDGGIAAECKVTVSATLYTVTVTNDGNGSASADIESGKEGAEVKLTATPNDGYTFKEWQVIKGGVTVEDNTFTIGTSDVEVKAVFEQEAPKPEPEPDPEPRPEPDPTPAPEPDPKPEPAPETFEYVNVVGDGNVWAKGSTLTSDFIFKRTVNDSETFSHFKGIQIDGQSVDASNYTAESGSVVIKLKPAYLETLSLGKHTFTALFDDGNAKAEFTVIADGASGKDTNGGARTGDDTMLGALTVMAVIALAVILVALLYRKKYSR